MSNIEKIKAEIERLKKILEGSTYYLDNSQQALGYSFALDDLKEFIDSLQEEKPSEDSEEDALLLERAWLTLDGFGHEELAERLRQFAERKGLIWK